MLSKSEANYLKAIYKISQSVGQVPVYTGTLAEYLHTTSASVTDMVKKLAQKELINYEKYYGMTLTREGHKQAIAQLRKHRLWETFLYEKLGMNLIDIHDIACQLEQSESAILYNALEQHLGYPKFDPHGDPIPNMQGNFVYRNQVLLSAITDIGIKYRLVGVKKQSPEFLHYLQTSSLLPGTLLEIKSISEFDKTIIALVNNFQETIITRETAQEIYVKLI